MSKPKPLTLFDEVARFTRTYFGTDAPDHIAKLITIHLHKPPQLITGPELIGLMDWIRGAVSFLEEDQEIIERYLTELTNLTTR